MNKSNIVIGIVAVIALVLGVVAYNHTPSKVEGVAGQQGVQGPRGPQGPKGDKGDVGPQGPAGKSSVVGSVTSPDLYSPYMNVNGVTKFFERKALSTATTSPCIYRVAATSTIGYTTVNVTTSSSTATTWRLVYNPTVPGLYAGASSTAIQSGGASTVSFTLPSGSAGVMGYMGTTTVFSTGVVGTSGVFPTGSYLIWEIAGVGLPSDTTKLNGFCQFEMRSF